MRVRQYLCFSFHPPHPSGCVLQIFGRLSHFHLPSSWNNTRITDAPNRTPLYLGSEDSGSVTPMTFVVTAYPLSHHHALNWNTLISSIMHVISLHVKIIYRYKWWRFLPFILCHPLRKTMHIFIYEFKQNYIAEISSKNLTTKT